VLVGCLYLPSGNPAPGPKFDYKLRWLERLAQHAETLLALNSPVALAGDYNVIPTELDVFAPERWVDDALFRPESRDAFARLLARDWTDALRRMHPEERIHTFWDYFRNHFGRDRGLRIDHLLLSPLPAPRLVGAGVDREVRGWEKASDHAPRAGCKSPTDLPPISVHAPLQRLAARNCRSHRSSAQLFRRLPSGSDTNRKGFLCQFAGEVIEGSAKGHGDEQIYRDLRPFARSVVRPIGQCANTFARSGIRNGPAGRAALSTMCHWCGFGSPAQNNKENA